MKSMHIFASNIHSVAVIMNADVSGQPFAKIIRIIKHFWQPDSNEL